MAICAPEFQASLETITKSLGDNGKWSLIATYALLQPGTIVDPETLMRDADKHAPVPIKYIIMASIAATPSFTRFVRPWCMFVEGNPMWRPLSWFVLTNHEDIATSLFGFLVTDRPNYRAAAILNARADLHQWMDLPTLTGEASRARMYKTQWVDVSSNYRDVTQPSSPYTERKWIVRLVLAPLTYFNLIHKITIAAAMRCISLAHELDVPTTPFIAALIMRMRASRLHDAIRTPSELFSPLPLEVQVFLSICIARMHAHTCPRLLYLATSTLKRNLIGE